MRCASQCLLHRDARFNNRALVRNKTGSFSVSTVYWWNRQDARCRACTCLFKGLFYLMWFTQRRRMNGSQFRLLPVEYHFAHNVRHTFIHAWVSQPDIGLSRSTKPDNPIVFSRTFVKARPAVLNARGLNGMTVPLFVCQRVGIRVSSILWVVLA